MRYAKRLATLSGAGAIVAALAIPAHSTAPSPGSGSRELSAPKLVLPMCHHTRVGACSVIPVTRHASLP